MPDFTHKKGECRNCKIQTTATLHLHVKTDGSQCFVWKCDRCNCCAPHNKGVWWIKKEIVRQYLNDEEISCLPVLMESPENRCVVCGERFAQMHHWAPRAIFGDKVAEQWPKDYLCEWCHKKWHKTVTPQLVIE